MILRMWMASPVIRWRHSSGDVRQQISTDLSASMRDEVEEVEQILEALLAVVEETIQPSRISLWLHTVGDN